MLGLACDWVDMACRSGGRAERGTAKLAASGAVLIPVSCPSPAIMSRHGPRKFWLLVMLLAVGADALNICLQ